MANFANRAEWKTRLHHEDLGRGWGQKFAAVLNHFLAIAVGEKSKMSDFDEAAGEHMKEEATDKLDRLQGHLFGLIVVLRVSPTEMNLAIFQVQQATVGNRYSVRVSRQILQDVLWAAKRRLGVNDPVFVAERGYELRETDRVCEFSNASMERKAVRRERLFEKSEKLATK